MNERLKTFAARIAIAAVTAFLTYDLYGAALTGTIRARRQGVVSVAERPRAFWFAVGLEFVLLVVIVGGMALIAWLRRGSNTGRSTQ